jgi:hypothetical protein
MEDFHMGKRTRLLHWFAVPALSLVLASGLTFAPTASAQCIGLQTGSEYCVGESAHLGPVADDAILAGDTSQFVFTAPETTFEATRYNGYSPSTWPYYGEAGHVYRYSDNEYCFPC